MKNTKKILGAVLCCAMTVFAVFPATADSGPSKWAVDETNKATEEELVTKELQKNCMQSSINKTDTAADTFVFPYNFSAQDLYGNTVTEESLGEKELFFVHFWATWCGPCVNEMPDLAKVAEKYGDKVGFIALLDDYSTAKETAIRIAEASGISFTMVDAKNKDLQELLKKAQSGYVPTTILIDSDGNIIGGQIVGSYGSDYGLFIDKALEK